MIDIAFGYEGTVEKVVGDGINVFFNAPLAQTDHAARAVACAMQMDAFASRFARDKRLLGIPLGDTRIGVNTGEVFVGNFGCTDLLHYTAHGDAVNATARLQAANRVLGTRVCVSADAARQVADFSGLPVGGLVLKGRSRPLMAYEPIAATQVDSPEVGAYLDAYPLLDAEDERALEVFTDLVERYPELRLAALHLKRLRSGQTGSTILPDV